MKVLRLVFFSLTSFTSMFSASARLTRRAQADEKGISFLANESTEENLVETGETGFNILALGGSVTWGSKLESRQHAWPFQMETFGPHKVTNHALRATGSFYPALCAETILKGDDTEYDVIALEFSINGAQAFDWLVRRLRARFPNAIIIYVHLFTLKDNIMDQLGKTPNDRGLIGNLETRNIDWVWAKSKAEINKVAPQVTDAEQYDMSYYFFPIPDSPAEAFKWYALDAHHLSPEGHRMVAGAVLRIAESILPPVKTEKVGTWGLGDYCDNWFSDGKINLQHVGGKIMPLSGDKYKDKFTLEFSEEGGSIILPNNGPRAPLWAHFMSGHVMYPITDVSIWDRQYTLSPNNDETFYHTVKTQLLGYAEKSAINKIEVKPRPGYGVPFRLVAIGYCGACYETVIGGAEST